MADLEACMCEKGVSCHSSQVVSTTGVGRDRGVYMRGRIAHCSEVVSV